MRVCDVYCQVCLVVVEGVVAVVVRAVVAAPAVVVGPVVEAAPAVLSVVALDSVDVAVDNDVRSTWLNCFQRIVIAAQTLVIV